MSSVWKRRLRGGYVGIGLILFIVIVGALSGETTPLWKWIAAPVFGFVFGVVVVMRDQIWEEAESIQQ